MTPVAPSPFLEVPEAEWVCANDLCFAIFDSFPVSPGHVLVVTRRVGPTFFECTAAEQQALMALVGEVKALLDGRLDPTPDGYNVGFNAGAAAGQTVPHVHVHVIPRYTNDTLSLTTGPDRPLWPRLAERLPGATAIDLLASFVQPSGLDVIRAGLFSAIAAGARVRLLVGDFLGITSPEALRQLLGWMDLADGATPLPEGEEGRRPGEGAFEARLVEMENLRGSPDSFHPKAWRIADSSGGIVVEGKRCQERMALSRS